MDDTVCDCVTVDRVADHICPKFPGSAFSLYCFLSLAKIISGRYNQTTMNFKSPFVYITGLVVVVILAAGGYFYYQNQQANLQKKQPASAADQVKKVVAEVGKLMELPTGEDPTVATVTDIDKLKDQPFFRKAKNGDQVLIYTKSKEAILYDPAANKIVEVAPLNIGTSSARLTGPTPSPKATPKPTSKPTPKPSPKL